MYIQIILSVLLMSVLRIGNGSNILGFFHYPSQSHHILGSALLKGLAKKGHNVTMVSPFPLEKQLPNYTDITLKGLLEFKQEHMEKSLANTTGLSVLKYMYTILPKMTEIVMKQESTQNLLASETKFDVVILFYPISEQYFAIGHHFNAPLILFTPLGTIPTMNTIAGNINLYSYVPHLMSTFSDTMTFMQRVINTLMGVVTEFLYATFMLPVQRSLIKEYFPNAPPLEELIDNIALNLVNTHYSTESPRPYTPNLIQIGGFHIEDIEPLSKDLQKYLDEAKEGVLYFSFGTNIKIDQLPEDKLNTIIKCLSKLKVKVLWKFDSDNIPKLTSNIKIEKWLPQKSILAHPNVRAFITHGGMGSVVEATHAGVPMLALPFFADQPKNVADAVNKKYAIILQFNDLTEELFTNALNQILNNPMYHENIKKTSMLLNDKPVKQMDLAIYWVEHVIRYKGANHLKPASTKLNIFQQLLLDVMAFLLATIIVAVLTIYYLIKGVCKLFTRKKRSNQKVKTS